MYLHKNFSFQSLECQQFEIPSSLENETAMNAICEMCPITAGLSPWYCLLQQNIACLVKEGEELLFCTCSNYVLSGNAIQANKDAEIT